MANAASTFFIRGHGYGHGIGMGQYGAYGYALHGKDYQFILAHYYQGTSLAHTNAKRIVRVLLQTGSASFTGASRAGNRTLNPSLTYSLRALTSSKLELDRSGQKVATFSTMPLRVTGSGPLNVVGLGTYRGSLEFRPDGAGGVQTVDAVALDNYVRGVVAGEMPASWAAEALKVQAVAARTYAITTSVGGPGYDLYSDTRSQVYGGVAAEQPSTDAAVAATSGQVVTYNGSPVVTYFSASSGGYTENIENVWSGSTPQPWLKGVPDPYDGAGGNPYHNWGANLSLSAAAAQLGGFVKGQLIGIKVTKHGASPRILLAQVVGTGGRTTVTGNQLLSAFGLRTTYVAFTAITTLPGPAPGSHASLRGRSTLPDGTLTRKAASILTPPHVLAIHGTVFPGPRGATFAVQRLGSRGWQTVQRPHFGSGGSYNVKVASAGQYRVKYTGLAGPSVAVS